MFQFTFSLLLSAHLSTAIFFHEQSAVNLNLKDKFASSDSAYGFSLGYQHGDKTLVIGAPRYDNLGKVFQCSAPKIKEDPTCQNSVDFNLNELNVQYDRTFSPEQYFYLGASIAATNNGFVVCAPLRTLNSNSSEKYTAFGVCFIHDNGTTKVWNLASDYDLVAGGSGWSALTDDKQDKVLISRFFHPRTASIVFTKMSNPVNFTKYDVRSDDIMDATIYGQAISSGSYFDKNNRCYAFSFKNLPNKGRINFICSNSSDLEPLGLLKDNRTIINEEVGSMFGAALCSADVTRDGLDELFVGAPAQVSDVNSFDVGAVHVYTTSNEMKMILNLTIWGVANGGRFGNTLSTSDVNGDSYPEIIISAPYEQSKDGKTKGVLYIICGFSLYRNKRSTVAVTDLPRTQVIERSKSFGFSLQPVADYTENGSDELAVGAPEQSTVTIYRGVPAITVNVTSEFTNKASDTNTEYSFSSCVTIKKPEKPNKITTRLLVKNILTGENVKFKSGETGVYNISLNEPTNKTGDLYQYCKNLVIMSQLSCKVNTTVYLVDKMDEESEFQNTWVELSPQSSLTKETIPQCNCGSVQCVPEYSLELQWGGRSGSNHKYVVGSSDHETVSIIVRNTGMMGCGACAHVQVTGLLPTLPLPCKQDEGAYTCELPTPFRRGTNETFDIQLLTNTLSNLDESLSVNVEIYKECTKPEAIKSSLILTYDYNKVLENVLINGSTINRTISDAELNDPYEDKLSLEQTFTIFNNQSFKWNNVLMTIETDNKPYIQNLTMRMRQSMDSCVKHSDSYIQRRSCTINLAANSTNEIRIAATIIKKDLASYLQSDTVKIVSKLTLTLSSNVNKDKPITTLIEPEQKERSPVVTIIIAIVVSLLVLLLIVFILYKLNFFKRKNKEELEELKREAMYRSVQSASGAQKPVEPEPVPEPEVDHDFDMVDLIVDETPLKSALSSEELNSLAAYSESTKNDTPKKGKANRDVTSS